MKRFVVVVVVVVKNGEDAISCDFYGPLAGPVFVLWRPVEARERLGFDAVSSRFHFSFMFERRRGNSNDIVMFPHFSDYHSSLIAAVPNGI